VPEQALAREDDSSLEEGGANGDAQASLDPAMEARRFAALSHVRKFGDPALRSRARDVVDFDDMLQVEIERMTTLMNDALGVGLAATQLGVMHRVLVYRTSPDAPFVALINPRLEWASAEEELAEEGCLSLPHVAVDVERPLHVRMSARDEQGEDLLVEASGLEARVIQHEVDHLDGVLILDRASKEQRKEALRILREGPGERPAAEAETTATATP
jgi:peptide deformylase